MTTAQLLLTVRAGVAWAVFMGAQITPQKNPPPSMRNNHNLSTGLPGSERQSPEP